MATPAQSSRHLDEELVLLRLDLYDMWELVQEQVANAINALSRNDIELARQVRAKDDDVDRLELEVDHQCERILALFTPVAVDLRLIISAVKINTDLERVGDHAKNLAKHVCLTGLSTELVAETNIREMADEVRWMLRNAHEAFFRRDQVLARQIIAYDQRVDRLYEEMITTTGQLIRTYPDQADEIIHLVHIGKSVERMADHAKNIGKVVVFLVEGVDIRHQSVDRNPDRSISQAT